MDEAASVVVECDSGNEYDGRLGLRISSIFVIGLGSMLGALLPVMAARTKRMRVPPVAFFITKYFGSGVIIATAFIHLLAPANEALGSPCLTGPITEYPWVEGIALMTVFMMLFVELMASRFEVFGNHDNELETSDPTKAMLRRTAETSGEKYTDDVGNGKSKETHELGTREQPVAASTGTSPESDADSGKGPSKVAKPRSSVPGREDDFSYPPGGEDHLGHHRDHGMTESDYFAAQMTAIFILEFGVIFHSIFIGLTLAVAGEEFNILYVVLVFHQTFEGLGLGSRLATASWPKKKAWMPWALGAAYGFTTPISIAVGLGVRTTYAPGSSKSLIVNGVFDSISAGILIYTGLVELMAHEFMFSPEMRKSSIKMMLFAFGCMSLGAGLMALLGKWA